MTTSPRPARQRGFALLIVLWSLGLLALLVGGLAASARTGMGLAGNVRDTAIAEAAADGAIQQAIFQLRRGSWQPDSTARRLALGHATVDIVIEDQRQRINPNLSSPAMLAALLSAVGVEPAQANDLSRLMVDWRTAATTSLAGGSKLDRYRFAGLPYGPPNRPFASTEEIGLVPGMTQDLLARLSPYVSVYQTEDAHPATSASFTQNVLRDAALLGSGSAPVGDNSPDQVVQIRAAAMLANGTRFVRRAVIRLAANVKTSQRAWQILTWK